MAEDERQKARADFGAAELLALTGDRGARVVSRQVPERAVVTR